jgi:UDP-galactopyranose mutase
VSGAPGRVAPRAPVLVVGAGVAGLAAASWLARRGHAVTLREAAPVVGGLLAPVRFGDDDCDRGSHRVHAEALPYLREHALPGRWVERPRRGVLVLGGRQAGYPLGPWRFARALGLSTTVRMAAGWAARPGRFARLQRWERDRREAAAERDEGYERFVLARVGRAAYEAFYRPYVEKVWGVEPAALSASVARQRFSSTSPLSRVIAARRGETFWYPVGGMGAIVDAMLADATALGVTVETGATADAAAIRAWPAVLHTGPLESVAGAEQLGRRGLYLLHLRYGGAPTDDVDTWYVPGAESWFGRVSRPAAFGGDVRAPASTVLAVEIPEGRWGDRRDFLAQLPTIEAQLRRAGVLRRPASLIAAKQTYVPGVYPAYRRGWVARWREAMAEVASRGGVYMAGRQGLYLHCNIDHAVASALEAARCLSEAEPATVWARRAERWLDVKVRD